MSETLYNKYRPRTFDEYEAPEYVKRSLVSQLKRGTHHAVMLSGDAGLGKTTLARLLADAMECSSIIELDAAQFSGVDTIRELIDQVSVRGFMAGKTCVIIDECHGLSSKACDALLKTVEEPPEHLMWVFNTTDAGRVPRTLTTRCVRLNLRPLPEEAIRRILFRIAHQEGIELSDLVLEKLVEYAHGVPRTAITGLGLCQEMETEEQLIHMLELGSDRRDVRDIVHLLMRSQRFDVWPTILGILDNNRDVPAESMRLQIVRHIAVLLFRERRDALRMQLLIHILHQFQTPYSSAEGMAPLLLSIANTLLLTEGAA